MKIVNLPYLFSLILVVFISIITIQINKPVTNAEVPGEKVLTLPAVKIERGEKHPDYPTNPPSSGWYTESNMRTGIFTSFVKDEQIIEFLTRGVVVVNYNCNYKINSPLPSPLPEKDPDLNEKDETGFMRQSPEEIEMVWESVRRQNEQCGDLIAGLRKIVENKDKKYFVLAPNPKLDTRIALISWGVIDKMMFVDEDRIERFMDYYIGRKPGL